MKKISLLVLCCGFFLCNSIVATAGHHKDKMRKDDPKMEALIKDKTQYVKKLDVLLLKYEAAGEKDKESIKKDIKKLIKSSLDKNATFKKAIIDKNKKIIEKLEKELADIKADRNKYIDDKVDFYVSPEGIAKAHDKASMNSEK
ncbi:MAG: hypothetical protein LBS29_01145 [Endomicrobium sp.]|nr:hypothetical protein [Endomicrobium sp.]